MHHYPDDHPFWQDVNFCPDWLYKHIQEPKGRVQRSARTQELQHAGPAATEPNHHTRRPDYGAADVQTPSSTQPLQPPPPRPLDYGTTSGPSSLRSPQRQYGYPGNAAPMQSRPQPYYGGSGVFRSPPQQRPSYGGVVSPPAQRLTAISYSTPPTSAIREAMGSLGDGFVEPARPLSASRDPRMMEY